ncbi:hypothetical protein DPEC_G00182280 [Dallia pectoralis]|uniref:Uncharacterized protein n=1 Tax=Dallia pectoralis TaxID=75939 RepID=A0ACC2GAL7_DALPE|nr:hypothetical protein DPEC_G00182280 [Dallia pectoralis]
MSPTALNQTLQDTSGTEGPWQYEPSADRPGGGLLTIRMTPQPDRRDRHLSQFATGRAAPPAGRRCSVIRFMKCKLCIKGQRGKQFQAQHSRDGASIRPRSVKRECVEITPVIASAFRKVLQ